MIHSMQGGRTVAAMMLALLISACGAAPMGDGPTLADREAVERTLLRYSQGLDRLDADLYVSAMAPDVVIAIDGDERQGHEAMRRIIAEEAALRQDEPRTLYHLEANPVIAFTGPDAAEHHAYWITMSRTPDGLDVLDVGTSSDRLRKIDGEWLIVRRDIWLEP